MEKVTVERFYIPFALPFPRYQADPEWQDDEEREVLGAYLFELARGIKERTISAWEKLSVDERQMYRKKTFEEAAIVAWRTADSNVEQHAKENFPAVMKIDVRNDGEEVMRWVKHLPFSPSTRGLPVLYPKSTSVYGSWIRSNIFAPSTPRYLLVPGEYLNTPGHRVDIEKRNSETGEEYYHYCIYNSDKKLIQQARCYTRSCAEKGIDNFFIRLYQANEELDLPSWTQAYPAVRMHCEQSATFLAAVQKVARNDTAKQLELIGEAHNKVSRDHLAQRLAR